MTSSVTYTAKTDTWVLSYDGLEDDATQDLAPDLPAGDFFAICQVLTAPSDPDSR